jgi:hypothetical protein
LGLKAEGAVTPELSGADVRLCGNHASGACASTAHGLSEHNLGVEA